MYLFYIIAITTIVLLCLLLHFEFKRDLMMFQQNSYRPERYMRWLKDSGDTTTLRRLTALFLVLLCLAGFGVERLIIILVAIFGLTVSIQLSRKKYKKPLAYTKRAIRLSIVCYFIAAFVVAVCEVFSFTGLFGKIVPLYTAIVALLIIYCASHLVLLLANFLLKPVENSINKKFYNNASAKLRSMPNMTIIGITGSYGKTSTKHYLYRILSERMETLMTPGSFNTTLGVVRTINEQLKPFHQAFIVEMGAKQKGDIKEICELVRPSLGIITAVGPQHLQTFHTIENVRDTKFELADMIPEDGYIFLNNDYPIIADRIVNNCHAVRYSCVDQNSHADYVASNIKYDASGTTFTLNCPNGKKVEFHTRLLGEYNIANLTAAIGVAFQLGIDEESVKFSVSRIEAVEHRLSMKRMGNGVTLLDDAFNSNPAGASMAVNVLSSMQPGRRIIITPGMIELGEKQHELNSKLGEHIAGSKIDYVAIVGRYNRDAITEGLAIGAYDKERILYFETFLDANAWMIAFAQPGDTVLIENDLPDTFK